VKEERLPTGREQVTTGLGGPQSGRRLLARFTGARKHPVFFLGPRSYESGPIRIPMSATTETTPADTPPALSAPGPEPVHQAEAPVEAAPTPPAPAAGAVRGGFLRAVGEWFARHRSIVQAKREAKELPPRQRDLLERARSALLAARDAREPAGPLENGPAFAPALELCRESVYWALAYREARAGAETVAENAAPELGELWARADRGFLLRAAGDPGGLAIVEHALARASFSALAELPEPEQRALLPRVQRFAATLLGSVDAPDNTLLRLRAERARRLGAVLFVLVVAFVGAIVGSRAYEDRIDIARGKAWKTSSTMAGCRSPKQSCGETPMYFFHTLEEQNPWVEIDLGSRQAVSAVRILNRKDCCPDRAIPLVVELSDDRVKYREVGRRTRPFMTHRMDFPRQSARYVRVRALKKTWLHFRGVLVLP